MQKAFSAAAISVGFLSFSATLNNPNIHIPLDSIVSPVLAEERSTYSVFVGLYNDPNHPGCLRKITAKEKDISIIGSDNFDGSNQW